VPEDVKRTFFRNYPEFAAAWKNKQQHQHEKAQPR
jgi:hypothetical protein